MLWDKFFRCYVGDCVDLMREMPEKAFHTCVTSPPYYALRDYGVEGQIGLEPTPAEFIQRLVEVFRAVRRVLRDDGTIWVNIGDSYAARFSGNNGYSDGRTNRQERRAAGVPAGVKPKDMLGMPWRLAFALQDDGWYLRQDIVWHKTNPMPESVRDRCTKAHEYVFLLSKRPKYYFDHEAIKEPVTGNSHPRGKGVTPKSQANAFGNRNNASFSAAVSGLVELRNRRTVWSVPTRPFKGAHFATFPPALVEPCILAGCPAGGAVIDPFGGSGTTAGVAAAYGRKAVLCELNPEYAALVPGRVSDIANSITEKRNTRNS